jgi:ornithine cyclodeaminase/alanine dehydrogenase-like protein (mu-crystallin family)
VLVIDQDRIDALLTWPALVDALDVGHRLGRGQTHDVLLEEGGDILLSRTAWKAGYGIGIKTVTGFFGNPGRTPPLPSVQGVFVLFDHDDGRPLAIIDGAGITAWKTAADSALGSRYLSHPDARCLLMVGAGALARPLIRAHLSVRPGIERALVWNRTPARAEALAAQLRAEGLAVEIAADLAAAVGQADIISSATRTEQPLIEGAWLQPGTHIDLVGAFTASMREADDVALRRGRLFVDARETTLDHIGELTIPIASGVIGRDDVVADLYDLAAGFAWQRSAGDITIFKNGGGAHLDLMTAIAIWRGAGECS